MQLEEMQTLWNDLSVEMEKQKRLTDSLIIKMTRADYRNKLNKILIPEAMGAAVGFAGLLFIVADFQKLNTWYLQVCGIVSALIIFIMPVSSIRAIRKMRSANISANTFKQALLEYSKGKMQFVFAKKLGIYLGAILMLVILPVMGALIGGKDFFKQTNLWFYYVVEFPFFFLFARWVFKCYVKITVDAENILKELEG